MSVRWGFRALLIASLCACGESGTGATDVATDVAAEAATDLATDVATDVPSEVAGDLAVEAEALAPAPVAAGVAKVDITPTFETYTDTNGNHVWDAGEPIDDTNKNGKLDTLWIGGFGPRQPTGVHDALTVRTLALRLHGDTFVFTALDTLGLSLKRADAIRAGVAAALTGEAALDPQHLFIAAIHTHQAPDTVGIFAPDQKPGWDEAYLRKVVDAAVQSIVTAAGAMKPAHLRVASAQGDGLARDIDSPIILDPYVGILQAVDAADGTAIATMATIANHPEAAWGDNTLFSADYPHYLRDKVETQLGGMAMYFSADEGLMQTPLDTLAPAGFERAQKVGETYADRIVAAVKAAAVLPDDEVVPTFGRDTLAVPLTNFLLAAAVVSEIAEGFKDYLVRTDAGPCSDFGCVDLPLPVLRIGSRLTFLCVPAEVTPELVIGGIVAPDTYASQYPDAPLEPVLKDHLATPDRFFVGLCGADVGYLYPKITTNMDAVFDQQNGPGPDCAGQYLTALEKVLDEVNARAGK